MLTGDEMKDFFQKVVDQVAELSTQASKVEGLQQQVNDLYNRLNALEQDNARLSGELAHANETVTRMEREASITSGQLETERQAVSALRETIYQRDTKVVEIEANLSQEKDAHRITLAERDDARRKADEVQDSLDKAQSSLAYVTQDRDTWQQRANELAKEVDDLRERLNRVNSILNPIRAVPSADVA